MASSRPKSDKKRATAGAHAPAVMSDPGIDTVPLTAPDPKRLAQALDKVVSTLREKYGKEIVARLNEPGAYAEVKRVVPTRLPALDAAFGVGGMPLGKIIEIYGPEHALKSTLSKHLAACAQASGVAAHEIDYEVSGARIYDEALGMSSEDTLVSQPDFLEQGMGILLTAIPIMQHSRISTVYLWDSVAAAYLEDELEGDESETTGYPLKAKYLSSNIPKLVKLLKNDDHGSVAIVFVNQIRQKLNAPVFAKQTDSPGGRAFRHYCHVRIEMQPLGKIPGPGGEIIGMKSRAKVIKNKLAPPFKEAELWFYFNPPHFVDPTAQGKPVRQPMVLPAET